MRSIQISVICTLFTVIIVMSGCQGSPVIPGNDQNGELTGSAATSSGASHQCLGYYTLVFDTENLSVDVLSNRSGDLHLNVVNVLNTTMGIAVAGVPSEHDPPTGLFVFDITLTHPFATKPQLAGFDVRGILMTPGTMNIGSLVFADIDETRLENADGYTRWWNPAEFTAPGMFGYTDGILANATASVLTATINPYKYFADSLSTNASMQEVYFAEMDADNGRGVFAAGENNTRRYRIRFPMDPGPQIVYGYAVDASWDLPSPNPPVEVPDDFPIEANMPEAYYMLAQPTVNTLYYDTETGNGGGVLRLQINVHDWQGQDAGDIHAEIDGVRIFSPDLMGGEVDAGFLNETSAKARYSADLFGEAVPSEAGEALVAFRARSAGSATYEQGAAPAPPSPLAAWNVIAVDITDPECTTDSDNIFADATLLELGANASGVVCPVTDITDYYYFNIPLTYEASGEIRVYSDAGPTTVTLYDHSHNVLAEEITSSMCVISLDDLLLLPGNYYIGIAADPTGDVRPYFLDLDGELIDASPCGAVEVTPDDLMVEADFVFMHENYAFLSGDFGIWIYDVTDPANPSFINFVEDPGFFFADFRYPYCYGLREHWLNSENQLDMIDFSDPSNPVIHEDLVHFTDRTGPAFCMDEQYLYIRYGVAPDYEIQIYDYITDPLNPTHVTDIATTIPPYVLAVTEHPAHGKYLVVGAYLEAWAYSIENLGAIVEVPHYILPASTTVTTLECDDETIYLIYRTGAWVHYLYTLQLDGLGTSLVYSDHFELPSSGYELLLDGPYLYLGDSNGLSVYDVSTPTAPVFDNTTEMIDYGKSMDISGDTLCIIPGVAGLEFFNMADPTSPVHYPYLPVCNKPNDMAAIGDYLFVADSAPHDGAVLTLDISDPANTFVAAGFMTPETPFMIDADGTNLVIYYYDVAPTFILLDASDPLNLSEIMSQTVIDSISEIMLTPDAVYIATDFPEVLVFDYSVIPPVNMGGIMLADDPIEMTSGLDHLYVTTYSGIEILDITSPLSPTYEGTYTPPDDQEMCEVAGDYLYITGDSTLEVASLADPSNPVYETHLEVTTVYDIDELAIDGQYVFVTGYETPIYAIQRLPVNAPSFSCNIHDSTDYSCYKILAHEGFLYEMNENEGVQIYDY